MTSRFVRIDLEGIDLVRIDKLRIDLVAPNPDNVLAKLNMDPTYIVYLNTVS